jgi:hypothetical protein
MRLGSPCLGRAASDYRWLLDRGYAGRAALKLVGDKYQMTRDERIILFRGVASSAASVSRAAALVETAAGRSLLVDGYNQVLTVMHYLTGRPLFLGTDGLVRDAGGSHGRIADQERFERAAGALFGLFAAQRPSRLAVFLDAPFPGSAGHAALFRTLLESVGLGAEVALERSADYPLKAAPPGSVVATSDSCVADAAAASGSGVYDSARWAIDFAFGHVDYLDMALLAGVPIESMER